MCWAVISSSLQKIIRTCLLVHCQDDFNFIVAIGSQILLALKQGLFSILNLVAVTFLTAHTLSRFAFPWCLLRIKMGL